MIKTFFCDIGNVLFFFSYDRCFRQVAELLGIDRTTVIQEFIETGLNEKHELGLVTTEQVEQRLRELATRPFTREELVQAVGDMFSPNEELIELTKKLADDGLQVILLSNIGAIYHQYIEERFIISDLCHKAVLSYQVGAMKPDVAIFHAALEIAGHAPHECFYVDDIPEFVDAAKTVDIDAERFTDMGKLQEDLHRRGMIR